MIEGLIGGLIAGAAYGIIGYARNKDMVNFDWKQFGTTVAGAAVIGAYAQQSGLAIDVVSASAIGVVITQTAKKIFNSIYEWLEDKGIINNGYNNGGF